MSYSTLEAKTDRMPRNVGFYLTVCNAQRRRRTNICTATLFDKTVCQGETSRGVVADAGREVLGNDENVA